MKRNYRWRTEDGAWLELETLDCGFEATLEVDERGLVRDYPSLFRRVG